MGIVASTKEIVVATLNYSGIMHSPFEFYSQESWKEEEKMSHCFKSILQSSYPNFDPRNFKWGLGKIDQKLQKQRYTPIYRSNAGVENGKLINEQEFRKRWKEQFNKAMVLNKVQATQEQIKNAQNFDLCCYRTFILHLYGEKDLLKAPLLDSKVYELFLHKFFSKSFLNQKQKIKQMFDAIQSEQVDVFFLQETSLQLQKALSLKEEYIFFRHDKSTSMVVLRRSKFNKIHNVKNSFAFLQQDLVKGLCWNQDTTICMADNFIFISVHLSSKKEKNPVQVKKMLEDIEKLQKAYPMCEFVLGGDINSFLPPEQIPKNFNVFPETPDMTTTMKKRTWLQPQVNKADQLNKQCKDSLLSTLPLSKTRIVTILGVDSKKISYIPNHEHPCDHFVVTANVLYRF